MMGRHFLLVSAVLITLITCAMPVLAEEGKLDEAPLTKADGLYMAYGSSFFSFDKCGNSALGERLREALVAKLESCPFTGEAKLEFYKKTALLASHELSGLLHFVLTHSPDKSALPDAEFCKQVDPLRLKHLQDKLAEYDAGKITLPEVVGDPKGSDEPYSSCAELSKAWVQTPVEGAPPGEVAGTGKHVNTEPSNK